MAHIQAGRATAAYRGDLVLFLIGMRINHWHKVGKWWPVFTAMPRMLAELRARPELGFLHGEVTLKNPRSPVLFQYWRSFEHLEAYARAQDKAHLPAWAKFNRAVGDGGAVGIWHETYIVPDGAYETIYGNMPPLGLGAVAGTVMVDASSRGARNRLNRSRLSQ